MYPTHQRSEKGSKRVLKMGAQNGPFWTSQNHRFGTCFRPLLGVSFTVKTWSNAKQVQKTLRRNGKVLARFDFDIYMFFTHTVLSPK